MEDQDHVYVVEKTGTVSVEQVLDQRGAVEEWEVQEVIGKVIVAVEALREEHGACPRALETDNIYLQFADDFDPILSPQSSPSHAPSFSSISSLFLTPIRPLSLSSPSRIAQSLGILYFHLLTGIHPLAYLRELQLGRSPRIRYNSNTLDIRVSGDGLRFMKRCLRGDATVNGHRFLRTRC